MSYQNVNGVEEFCVVFGDHDSDHAPVKDRSKEDFLTHIFKAFPNDQSIDPERLTQAVLKVVATHVSEGEMDDIRSIVPKRLRDLIPKA